MHQAQLPWRSMHRAPYQISWPIPNSFFRASAHGLFLCIYRKNILLPDPRSCFWPGTVLMYSTPCQPIICSLRAVFQAPAAVRPSDGLRHCCASTGVDEYGLENPTDAQNPPPKNFPHLSTRRTAKIAQTQIESVGQKFVGETMDY